MKKNTNLETTDNKPKKRSLFGILKKQEKQRPENSEQPKSFEIEAQVNTKTSEKSIHIEQQKTALKVFCAYSTSSDGQYLVWHSEGAEVSRYDLHGHEQESRQESESKIIITPTTEKPSQ